MSEAKPCAIGFGLKTNQNLILMKTKKESQEYT